MFPYSDFLEWVSTSSKGVHITFFFSLLFKLTNIPTCLLQQSSGELLFLSQFYDYTFQMTEKEEASTTMFLTSADLPHIIKHFSKISLVEHDV